MFYNIILKGEVMNKIQKLSFILFFAASTYVAIQSTKMDFVECRHICLQARTICNEKCLQTPGISELAGASECLRRCNTAIEKCNAVCEKYIGSGIPAGAKE